MFRYKVTPGSKLMARKGAQQKTDVAAGCKALNQMLKITKPESGRAA